MPSVAIGVQHTRGNQVTFFSDRWLLLPSVATGVQHTSVKSGGGLVRLFSDRWLILPSVVIGVQHKSGKLLGDALIWTKSKRTPAFFGTSFLKGQ